MMYVAFLFLLLIEYEREEEFGLWHKLLAPGLPYRVIARSMPFTG